MLFGYLTLLTALVISLSAAVYSILGLTAIFAAAYWPVVVMGSSLEFGKIVTTLWLHKYWDRAEIQYKVYLCAAVAILMLLTSMGVFGFLSKAHTDQSLVSGDVQGKIAIYDEKIKIGRDNIDANRKALTQMDTAVDQVMARSTTEGGADKAVQIRRGQSSERARLLKEIDAEQKKITVLNDESAPIRAEVRKVEAEVGPIKYIAAMIYGDNPDANVLEKSVRWVIILIVIVFDPLALTLLLAATKALEWERGLNIFALGKKKEPDEPTYEQDDGELTEEQWNQLHAELQQQHDQLLKEPPRQRQASGLLRRAVVKTNDNVLPSDLPLEPVDQPASSNKEQVLAELDTIWKTVNTATVKDTEAEHAPIEEEDHAEDEGDPIEKQAMRVWKDAHPRDTIKKYRTLYRGNHIKELPWKHADYHPAYATSTQLTADNDLTGTVGEVKGFGVSFPASAVKGDMFLRVDQLPSVLYKFNGINWIVVDKNLSENYAYDQAYIDHLIDKIGTGEYDIDLLSDAERSSIEQHLKQNPKV